MKRYITIDVNNIYLTIDEAALPSKSALEAPDKALVAVCGARSGETLESNAQDVA